MSRNRKVSRSPSPVEFQTLEGREMMSASPTQLPAVQFTGNNHLPAVQATMQDFHRSTFQDFHRTNGYQTGGYQTGGIIGFSWGM